MSEYAALSSNRAAFSCAEIPNTNLQITSFSIPSISLPLVEHTTPVLRASEPGNVLDFEPLQLTFLVDEELNAWKDIMDWMIRLAPFDCRSQQYRKDDIDAALTIFSSHNNELMKLKFVGLFPTNLGEIEFTEEDSEAVFKICTATFAYTYYVVA